MEIEVSERDIDKIIPYERNPRKNDEAVDKVALSLKEFGWQQPIVVDTDGVIVVGHTRWKAAKKLNYKTCPVIVASTLSPEQIKAYRIADNKSGEIATWDMDLLKMEVQDLIKADFDVELTGFDLEELELNDDGSDKGDGLTDVDAVPEIDEEQEPITKTGDIWQLGGHRLMCGDSTKIEDVERLMNGVKADMVFTDPPYGVSYEKKTKDIFKNTRYTAIANDDLKIDDFAYFINDVFINVCAFLKDSGSYYIFSCQGGDQELMMMMMMRQNNIKCRHQLIWVKDSPVFSMGRLDYDYKHEPILYGWKKNHVFYRNGNQDKSVWQFKRTENKLHPTMKPVELIENAILNSTEKDMLVIDYFLGSGSTLIACEKTGRRCFGMEISPKYVDVAVKRWEEFTGKKAELVENQ